MSALKLAAKETSPASMTSHQPRLWATEKKSLNIFRLSVSAGTVFPIRFFCS